MRRQIGAMIGPFALLAAALAASAGATVWEDDGITATVGVTPSCPYGLAG
jgi:hypothetical protein